MLVCGAKPSCTGRRPSCRSVAPLTVLIGRLLNSSTHARAAVQPDRIFRVRRSSRCPPAGSGSAGSARSRRRSATAAWRTARRGSRSTMIWRFLPPNGSDTVAPCTVASGVRMKLLPEVEDLLLAQRLAAQPELQNRHARRVVLQHLRRKRARRHVADLDLALRHDLRQREIHLHVRMEVDADDRRRSDATAIRCARCRRRSWSARARSS